MIIIKKRAIAVVISVVMVTVLGLLWYHSIYAKVVSDRLEFIQEVHDSQKLVGLTLEECEEILGPVSFIESNVWIFRGGYSYTKIMGMSDRINYNLWVNFEKNRAVSTSIKRDMSE